MKKARGAPWWAWLRLQPVLRRNQTVRDTEQGQLVRVLFQSWGPLVVALRLRRKCHDGRETGRAPRAQ